MIPVDFTPRLHYVFDPLCGWCYGAAPLLAAVSDLDSLQLALHGGGMMVGEFRIRIDVHWRDYVLQHDHKIADITGQPFGTAYTEGLLRDTTVWLDSAPPTTAILAAERLSGKGLEMLHAIQSAHYVHGLKVSESAVLLELASNIGLDLPGFQAMFAELADSPTQVHFVESRLMLQSVGGQGFPTLALELAPDELTRIDVGPWLGRPAAWRAYIEGLLNHAGNLIYSEQSVVCELGKAQCA